MKQAAELFKASKALLTYIGEEYVFDKMADAGCGGVDPYRSERFDTLIKQARQAVEDFEREWPEAALW